MAEGYQVNTISTRQLGIAIYGLCAETWCGEPVFQSSLGMAFMDKTVDLSASMTAISPTCTAIVDGKKYKTDNDISTPFSVFGAFSIYDNLKA